MGLSQPPDIPIVMDAGVDKTYVDPIPSSINPFITFIYGEKSAIFSCHRAGNLLFRHWYMARHQYGHLSQDDRSQNRFMVGKTVGPLLAVIGAVLIIAQVSAGVNTAVLRCILAMQ